METGKTLRQAVLRFPSSYIWEDELGVSQDIAQGEGGEQGDPLMPLLFNLGQHRALEAIATRLEEGERLFAYLDDVYVVCNPARLKSWSAMPTFACIWEDANLESRRDHPHRLAELTAAARRVKPDAVVWRGDAQLPVQSQGVRVPRIPAVEDLQSGWLLLLMCGATRANFGQSDQI